MLLLLLLPPRLNQRTAVAAAACGPFGTPLHDWMTNGVSCRLLPNAAAGLHLLLLLLHLAGDAAAVVLPCAAAGCAEHAVDAGPLWYGNWQQQQQLCR
jgi:hypothetical protein